MDRPSPGILRLAYDVGMDAFSDEVEWVRTRVDDTRPYWEVICECNTHILNWNDDALPSYPDRYTKVLLRAYLMEDVVSGDKFIVYLGSCDNCRKVYWDMKKAD